MFVIFNKINCGHNFLPYHSWIKLSGEHVHCGESGEDEEFCYYHKNDNTDLEF